MASYVGIDLGTTFSAVATLDETGRPVIVPNRPYDKNITPSVVSISSPTSVLVGEEALNLYGISDPNTFGRFKRHMGTSKVYEADGEEHTPTSLSSLLLKKLVEDTVARIGPIEQAVVTIPANFANDAREATLQAARDAGLNIGHIINEPTAAALYYAFKSDEELAGTYAVYDLGGGTFDISIIKVTGQDVEVIATNGVQKLGGDDFDEVMRTMASQKYESEMGGKLEAEDFTKNEAEVQKKSLSVRESCRFRVRSGGGSTNITVTRDEFEEATSSLIAQTEMLCESVMDEANITPDDIQMVFFAGGSTRAPRVTESVRRIFKQEPISTANVDEVVALGAALYAAYKSDQSQLNPIQAQAVEKIKVAEVTSMFFGTISMTDDPTGQGHRLNNSILIRKNERIPCSVTEPFYTMYEGQDAIDCRVTESGTPETDPNFVNIIWRGDLALPPDRPTGQEIQITYSYTENQTMKCEFLDVESGKRTEIDLNIGVSQGKAGDAIEKFTVE